MTNIASEEAGPARVFLSSTSDDIPDFRQAAIRVIQSVPWTVCAFMEDYSAKPHSARIVDDHEVDSCDFFIGILGFEYGNCPPESTLSFTELEFEAAIDRQKPRFMFLYQPTDPTATKNKASTADPRQEQFRSRVKELHIVDFFATTIDLVAGILKVLRQIDPESSNELVATRELPATWAEIPGPPECYLARAPGLDSAFTGRHQDLDLLQGWIENDKKPIYVLQALGGMGKTCLVRQCISQWSGIGSDNPYRSSGGRLARTNPVLRTSWMKHSYI